MDCLTFHYTTSGAAMAEPYILHHTFNAHSSSINCLAFSVGGHFLASGHKDGSIRIWNPHDREYLHRVEIGSLVLCLQWHPLRHSHIFCGCQDGTVAYIDEFGHASVQSGSTEYVSISFRVRRIELKQASMLPMFAPWLWMVPLTRSLSPLDLRSILPTTSPAVHLSSSYSAILLISAPDNYGMISILPKPKDLPTAPPNSDACVRGRSLAFVKEGRRLVVTYLNHGVMYVRIWSWKFAYLLCS
jgi:WD40 repeat protein